MALRLIILGLMQRQDLHPYEVLQIMKEQQMHQYIKINYGTLYYAFEQLVKQNLIKVKEVIRDEKRPDKTVYQITDAGRKEFEQELYERLNDRSKIYHPLFPSLLFVHQADQKKVLSALEERRTILKKVLEKIQNSYKEHLGCIPLGSLMIFRSGILASQAELQWLDEFIDLIKAGKLPFQPIPSEDNIGM